MWFSTLWSQAHHILKLIDVLQHVCYSVREKTCITFLYFSRLDYNNWAATQPDHGGNERCLELLGDYNYKWNNVWCGYMFAYICEKGSNKKK